MTDNPAAIAAKRLERELPMDGYFDCCGRSRMRGHWENCYRNEAVRDHILKGSNDGQ